MERMQPPSRSSPGTESEPNIYLKKLQQETCHTKCHTLNLC